MASSKNTIKFGGKEVPLTKAGLPSLIHLTKSEREVVKEYATAKKRAKQEILTKELQDILSRLG